MEQARYFTVGDAARMLGITGSRVRQVAIANRIGFKPHRFLRFLAWADVERIGECQAPVRGRYRKAGKVLPRSVGGSPVRQPDRVRAPGEPVEFSASYWCE